MAAPVAKLTHPRTIRVFASQAGEPRSRRASDAVVLVAALLITGLSAAWGNADPGQPQESLSDLVDSAPDWLHSLAAVGFFVAALYTVGLIVGVALVAHGRRRLVRDMLLTLAATFLLGFALSLVIDGDLPEVAWGDASRAFPALRVAAVTAVLSVASPHLSRPMRRVGMAVIVGAFVGALSLEFGVPGAIGGLALGWATASAILLVFGSPGGHPTPARARDALADLGVAATDVHMPEDQPWGAAVMEATDEVGRPLVVKIFGRDAGNAQFLAKAWRFVWYRDTGPTLTVTRLQQVEHEALVTVLAERAGVSVAEVIAVGRTDDDDAVLAVHAEGTRLADIQPDAVTDDLLSRVWSEAGRLQETGFAHGALNASNVMVADGQVSIVDFETSSLSPPLGRLGTDVAELLASTALIVGNDRAVEAAIAGIGTDAVVDAFPYLQTTALTGPLRRALHGEVDLGDLRDLVADRTGAEVPELEKLQRVRVRDIALMGFLVFAAYLLLTSLAEIGFDTIVDELSSATWGWVALAFVTSQLTNVTQAVGTLGAVPRPVPLGPTTMLQFAISFINLVMPVTAARIAMNVRFLQKLGVPTAPATSSGALDSLAGFGVQIILLLLLLWLSDVSIDTSQLELDGTVGRLVAIVGVALVVAVIVVMAIPKLRRKVLTPVREAVHDLRRVVTSPRQLALLFSGNLATQLLFAITLGLSVLAYGESVSLGNLVLINTVVSLFAGLLPIPGGVGVTEAGLIAGLTAVGVSESTAVAAVITHRLLTYYLPPIWGYFAARWLTNRDYL